MLLLLACTPKPDVSEPVDSTPPIEDTSPPVDTGDSATTPQNQAPSAPGVAITPTAPPPGSDFSVVIVTPSTDPDGDAVSYRYAWTVDGATTSVTEATVPGADTILLQVWTVTVTPTDGIADGASATASVTIGNEPPTTPGITLSPEQPVDGDTITLTIDPVSTDPEGDPITTTIAWYDDGAEVSWVADLTEYDGRYVEDQEEIRVVVSVTDGYHDPIQVEATVNVAYTCENLPPFNLDDTTLSDARAYHGIVFDSGGYLIGYDARQSLVRTLYGGTYEVWVPGVGTLQQMDTLPDGDFVMGDSSYNRLLRVTSAGGTETLASDVGSVYGVVVGPDGKVWVANGTGILRVDPDTGEAETVLGQGSGIYTHSLNFSLDSTELYIGVIGASNIYSLALDANLDAVGSPTTYATGVGGGYHDGLDLDECGNLYVADYTTRGLYRVETDGTVTSFVTADPTSYGHGVVWGNGIGGWRSDTIYQPQPYNDNTVREVVVGFASGDSVRTWNGALVGW